MIRKGTPADIPAVAAIYEHILDRETRGGTVTGWVRGVYPTEQTVREALEKDELFVLEEDGKILAAAKINREQVPEYADCPWLYEGPAEKIMVLHTLVVEPGAAGKGCGSRFVAFYEDYAREQGCTILRMDTNAINTPARTLYKKLGYREAGIVPCVFNGIPDVQLVCLEKQLTDSPTAERELIGDCGEEHATMSGTSALQYLREQAGKYISKMDAIMFGSSFLMTLLVHLYLFTNKFMNPDDVDGMYDSCSFGLSYGRWLLTPICKLTGSYSSAWLNGVVGALFLAAAVTLVVRLFEIRHILPALLTAACMVSFPAVASTYIYMFCAMPYLFGLMLSVLGAYLARRETVLGVLLGGVCITLGIGCYQANFGIAAVLLVVLLILDICQDRFCGDWKPFMAAAVKYVAALLLGMVFYFAALKISLYVTGTELTQYQGLNEMGQLTLGTMLKRVADAYRKFFVFYKNGWKELFHTGFAVAAYLCMAVSVGAVVYAVISKKLYRRPVMMVFLALLILVFPLASNLIYVMAEAWTIHVLMVYPMVIVLTLPMIAVDRIRLPGGTENTVKRRALLGITAAALCLELVCGYEGFLLTNRAYFTMDMTYRNVYAYYVKLAAKLETTPGYTPDSTVALIGTATAESQVPPNEMTGVVTGDNALNFYSRTDFLSYFLGSTYRYAQPEEREIIRESAQFRSMPCYPAAGSIQNIGGTITVKFSD